MKRLAYSSALTLMLMTPAAIGMANAQGTSSHSKATKQGSQASPAKDHANSWVQVTSAEELAGRSIRSADGKDAGRIDSIVVDLSRGEAIYALIGAGGELDLGADRIALPFPALQLTDVPREGPISVNQPLDKLRNAMHYPPGNLGQLSSTDQMRQAYENFGVVMPSGFIVPPAGVGSHPSRYMLVRPSQLAMLDTNATARQVRGMDVERKNGDMVGEIDQIVIDTKIGRIAYLLLSSGGFLGIGNDWVPVPPEAISWSADKNSFELNDKGVKPEAMQRLHRTDLPTRVHREQLEALYNRFHVKPYWTSANEGQKG